VLSNDKLSIPEAEIEKLVREVDANKDKVIDYSEFIEMMKNDLKVLMATYKMSLTDLIVFRP
jgi:Ca2+-binding EF-hand superfamily protein